MLMTSILLLAVERGLFTESRVSLIYYRKKLNGVTTQTTTIELSTKVLDTAEKLRQTLAHELVHVAAWTLSNELKPPHGDAFKLWFVSPSFRSVLAQLNESNTYM